MPRHASHSAPRYRRAHGSLSRVSRAPRSGKESAAVGDVAPRRAAAFADKPPAGAARARQRLRRRRQRRCCGRQRRVSSAAASAALAARTRTCDSPRLSAVRAPIRASATPRARRGHPARPRLQQGASRRPQPQKRGRPRRTLCAERAARRARASRSQSATGSASAASYRRGTWTLRSRLRSFTKSTFAARPTWTSGWRCRRCKTGTRLFFVRAPETAVAALLRVLTQARYPFCLRR
jgi:hypothetical protein